MNPREPGPTIEDKKLKFHKLEAVEFLAPQGCEEMESRLSRKISIDDVDLYGSPSGPKSEKQSVEKQGCGEVVD